MSVSVSSIIAQFFEWAECALAPNTVAAYRHQLLKIPQAVREKNASEIRPVDMTAWAKSWHEAQALVRLLNWAATEAGLIPSNPLTRVRLPMRGQRRRIANVILMEKLIRKSRPRSRAFLIALRESMARPQEIRAAAFEHLQSEDMETPIEKALIDGKALIVQTEFKDRRRRRDTSRPRVILVSRRLGRLILRLWHKSDTKSGPIFLNTRGKAWTKNAVRLFMRSLRRRLGIVADAMGENVVAYTFRHSLATLAAARGAQETWIAEILGHTETRTTRRYLHFQVGHLREGMERYASNRGKVR